MWIMCNSAAPTSQIYKVTAYSGASRRFGDDNDTRCIFCAYNRAPSVSSHIVISSACGSCVASLSLCRKSIMTSATWLIDGASVTHNGVSCSRASVETFAEIGRQYCRVGRCILGSDARDKSRPIGKGGRVKIRWLR